MYFSTKFIESFSLFFVHLLIKKILFFLDAFSPSHIPNV